MDEEFPQLVVEMGLWGSQGQWAVMVLGLVVGGTSSVGGYGGGLIVGDKSPIDRHGELSGKSSLSVQD